MAASPATSRKPRKQNFSASEISVPKEKVEENLSVLESKDINIFHWFPHVEQAHTCIS